MAPILVLPMRRDAQYERPHALCERHRTLLEHGRVRAGPLRRLAQVAGRGLLVCEVSPTGAPRPSCCCVPLGALLKGKQIGPGRQPEPLASGC